EEGVLLAQDRANPLAQPFHRGVLVLLLVAHLGLGHGFPHAGGGLRLGVAVKIDESVLHGVLCSPAPPYRQIPEGGKMSQIAAQPAPTAHRFPPGAKRGEVSASYADGGVMSRT